jgi:hypothetical protein
MPKKITDEKRYEYNHRYYWKNRKRIIQRNMKYNRTKHCKQENKPVDKDKPFLTTISIY